MQSSQKFTHYDLAVLCDRVYDKPDSELWTTREVDCLVKRRGDTVALCFRGTQAGRSWPNEWSREGLSNTRDVIRDLRFWPWRCPVSGQWVHKGFGISAYWWWKRFHRELPNARYVITGHSLGAAIAPMVARIMVDFGMNVSEVVIFGEPKGHYFGSERDYRAIGVPTVSYRHQLDWIQHAGFGATCVAPVVLDSRGMNAFKSHHVAEYARSLRSMNTLS